MSRNQPIAVLHGGAQRLPVRWANVEGAPPATISRYRVEPGAAVTRHVHTGKTEYWLIIAGQGIARVGADDIPVQEGDIVITVPRVPHELLNTGLEPLLFVNVVQPAGDEPVTTTELA
jgi:mannose-6-phosphate isomerase-like protein (cupin superfamily)